MAEPTRSYFAAIIALSTASASLSAFVHSPFIVCFVNYESSALLSQYIVNPGAEHIL